MASLLIIDNYDSFTYNLVQAVGSLFEGQIQVIRNDAVFPGMKLQSKIGGLIVSPGPGKPKDIPGVNEIIAESYKSIPVLGVCLGMQCINELFGGQTVRAPYPVHGKTSVITHNRRGIFESIPNNINVARYHSLMSVEMSSELEITAKTEDGIVMGIEHKQYPLWGVQFHPESFLCEYGIDMIKNFLRLIK